MRNGRGSSGIFDNMFSANRPKTKALAAPWSSPWSVIKPATPAPYIPQSSADHLAEEAAQGLNTRRMIYDRANAYLFRLTILRDAQINRLTQAAAAGQVPSCKISNGGAIRGCMAASEDPNWTHTRWLEVPKQEYIQPIGVMSVLGFGFTPQDFKKGNATHPDEPTFEASVSGLNSDATWEADHAIYMRSQIIIAARLYGVDLSERINLETILVDPSDATGLVGLLTRPFLVTGTPGSPVVSNPSLNQLMGLGKASDGKPWLSVSIPGYGLNPITPTQAELTQSGGALKFYRRGGYLIVRNCTLGTEPLQRRLFSFVTGFCKVESKASATASCNGLPIPLVIQMGSRPFLTYAKILSPGQYQVRAQFEERGLAQKIINGIASAMASLTKALCISKDVVAGYNNSLAVEACVDTTTKKPCKKGDKNCVCTGPTMSQTMAINAGTAAMTAFCGKIFPVPGVPSIPGDPAPADNTWMWLVGGAVLVGGILFTRNR